MDTCTQVFIAAVLQPQMSINSYEWIFMLSTALKSAPRREEHTRTHATGWLSQPSGCVKEARVSVKMIVGF